MRSRSNDDNEVRMKEFKFVLIPPEPSLSQGKHPANQGGMVSVVHWR